jgi:hypothetical protein
VPYTHEVGGSIPLRSTRSLSYSQLVDGYPDKVEVMGSSPVERTMSQDFDTWWMNATSLWVEEILMLCDNSILSTLNIEKGVEAYVQGLSERYYVHLAVEAYVEGL